MLDLQKLNIRKYIVTLVEYHVNVVIVLKFKMTEENHILPG